MKTKLSTVVILIMTLLGCSSGDSSDKEELAAPVEERSILDASLLGAIQEYADNGIISENYANNLNLLADNRILLTVTAEDGDVAALKDKLLALGMTNIAEYKHLISGVLPIQNLEKLSGVGGISWVSSNRATSHSVGFATNKGETGMYADVIKKTHDLDGSGISIGVLSDSYNCLGGAELDVAFGDLPNDVKVVKEYTFCAENPRPDEGRAMMQLIHDIAPAAKLMFYTAWEGPVAFAQGIIALADNGADIIVDDIGYLTMPMFQEGPIAQAVNEVTARGVSYFSAAGNSSRRSYENDIVFSEGREKAHDFGLAAGQASDLYQKIIIPKDTTISIALQWASPYEIANGKVGATSDLDVFLFNADKSTFVASSSSDNIGHDPVEFLSYTTATDSESDIFYLQVRHMAGDEPKRIKYVLFGPGLADIERAEKLYIQEGAEGIVFFHINNDEEMTAGKAVIVMPTEDTQFNIIDLADRVIEKDDEGQFFITSATGQILLNNQDIWFVPDGFDPIVLRGGELVLIPQEAENTQSFIAEYNTNSSTVFGHANASGTIAVGAMSYQQSPPFSNSLLIESFSSAGGTPILYDKDGVLLATPEYHPNPAFIALDDIDTTFFPAINDELDSDGNGLPNFKGTSAAAPNAAAVAALLLQKFPYLRPENVKQVMMLGTIDLVDTSNVSNEPELGFNPCLTESGFDWGTGCGLLQADKMIAAAENLPIDNEFGEFTGDSCIDATDKSRLLAALRLNLTDPIYDLNKDGLLNEVDLEIMDTLLLADRACS